MAWQHIISAQQKWNNSAAAGFSRFSITFFIAMYSITFCHLVRGIMGMVLSVGTLWVHLSWDLMSLVS